jgi:geranylgeranyl diphosphate synthase type I
MLNELKNIAKRIDDLIINDDFPTIIEPDYLRGAVIDYPGRGGKRLRPALLMWCCGLLGGDIEKTLYPAIAVEIYHNWTLVHDDIIDDDTVRRGIPTTHCSLATYAKEHYNASECTADKFGRDFAILTGDIQQGWAVNSILKAVDHGVSAKVTIAMARRMQELVNRELISGEALDVEFPMRGWQQVSSGEVEDMLYLKTGALLRFCAEAGAAIALDTDDFDSKEIRNLGEFAASAGIAFQLRDDWLGIFGEFKKLGKSIGGDLAEEKPTILLLKAFEHLAPNEQQQLSALMGLDEYTEDVIEQVRALMRHSGAEEYVLSKSAQLAQKAKSILAAFPDNQYKQYLMEFTDFLVNRDK